MSVRLTTRPVAKVPPRSVPPGLGICDVHGDGARRRDRSSGSRAPRVRRSAVPSATKCTIWPTRTRRGLTRRHRGRELQRAVAHDGEHRRALAPRARRPRPAACSTMPAGRRDDARVARLVARRAQPRVGRGEPRARRRHRLLRALVVALGDRARLEQLRVLLERPLRVREIRLARRRGRPRRSLGCSPARSPRSARAAGRRSPAGLRARRRRQVALDARADVDRLDRVAGRR